MTIDNIAFGAFCLLMCGVSLRMYARSDGDSAPVKIVIGFFLVTFAPSLLYALVHGKSSGTLFAVSLLLALIICAYQSIRHIKSSL